MLSAEARGGLAGAEMSLHASLPPPRRLGRRPKRSTAWRAGGDTGLTYHPAWHDLDEEGRREAFERTALLRQLESALAPDGLSSTGRRVMALIGGG